METRTTWAIVSNAGRNEADLGVRRRGGCEVKICRGQSTTLSTILSYSKTPGKQAVSVAAARLCSDGGRRGAGFLVWPPAWLMNLVLTWTASTQADTHLRGARGGKRTFFFF